MIESGYYPLGAEFDPFAPWNQEDPIEEDVECSVSQELYKDITLSVEIEGSAYDAFAEQDYTPKQLLDKFAELLEALLREGRLPEGYRRASLKEYLEACKSWKAEDIYIE